MNCKYCTLLSIKHYENFYNIQFALVSENILNQNLIGSCMPFRFLLLCWVYNIYLKIEGMTFHYFHCDSQHSCNCLEGKTNKKMDCSFFWRQSFSDWYKFSDKIKIFVMWLNCVIFNRTLCNKKTKSTKCTFVDYEKLNDLVHHRNLVLILKNENIDNWNKTNRTKYYKEVWHYRRILHERRDLQFKTSLVPNSW